MTLRKILPTAAAVDHQAGGLAGGVSPPWV